MFPLVAHDCAAGLLVTAFTTTPATAHAAWQVLLPVLLAPSKAVNDLAQLILAVFEAKESCGVAIARVLLDQHVPRLLEAGTDAAALQQLESCLAVLAALAARALPGSTAARCIQTRLETLKKCRLSSHPAVRLRTLDLIQHSTLDEQSPLFKQGFHTTMLALNDQDARLRTAALAVLTQKASVVSAHCAQPVAMPMQLAFLLKRRLTDVRSSVRKRAVKLLCCLSEQESPDLHAALLRLVVPCAFQLLTVLPGRELCMAAYAAEISTACANIIYRTSRALVPMRTWLQLLPAVHDTPAREVLAMALIGKLFLSKQRVDEDCHFTLLLGKCNTNDLGRLRRLVLWARETDADIDAAVSRTLARAFVNAQRILQRDPLSPLLARTIAVLGPCISIGSAPDDQEMQLLVNLVSCHMGRAHLPFRTVAARTYVGGLLFSTLRRAVKMLEEGQLLAWQREVLELARAGLFVFSSGLPLAEIAKLIHCMPHPRLACHYLLQQLDSRVGIITDEQWAAMRPLGEEAAGLGPPLKYADADLAAIDLGTLPLEERLHVGMVREMQ